MTRHVPIKKKLPGDKSFKTKWENTEDTTINQIFFILFIHWVYNLFTFA